MLLLKIVAYASFFIFHYGNKITRLVVIHDLGLQPTLR